MADRIPAPAPDCPTLHVVLAEQCTALGYQHFVVDRLDCVAMSREVDFIALSFVSNGREIEETREKMKKLLGREDNLPQIVAKIERKEAIKNIDEIILVECVWVLLSFYKYTKEEIEEILFKTEHRAHRFQAGIRADLGRRIWPGHPGRRDQPRWLPAVGHPDEREARQGPL